MTINDASPRSTDEADFSLIDSHIHLDFPEFDGLREPLMQRLRRHGLCHAIIPGVSGDRWVKQLKVAAQYQCSYALGIHPWYCDDNWRDGVDKLSQLVQRQRKDNRLVAIGECGLDRLHQDNWSSQQGCFEAQLMLAQHHELPPIIHSVRAHNEVFDLLRCYPLTKQGVIHGFYGGLPLAKRYLDLGMKLGIGHLLLDDNAKKLTEVIANLPLSSFVIETDMALAPTLKNTKLSDDSNQHLPILCLLVEKIARLQKKPSFLVSEQIRKNTIQLFNL